MKHSILKTHYLDYLEAIKTNKTISHNLNEIQIQELYDKKYDLTEFDIYKYITAYDHISESLGINKYTLTEGITSLKNRYNNILIDLFYHNIPSQIINHYSISEVFKIKQKGSETYDLTKWDLYNL
jgi:hypothetical protein